MGLQHKKILVVGREPCWQRTKQARSRQLLLPHPRQTFQTVAESCRAVAQSAAQRNVNALRSCRAGAVRHVSEV